MKQSKAGGPRKRAREALNVYDCPTKYSVTQKDPEKFIELLLYLFCNQQGQK